MNTAELTTVLTTLHAELVDGAPPQNSFMLNGGDPGLLRSLDRLDAAAASATHGGGASIAAHVEHLRYGLSLMNRWATEGGNPFAGADWAAAWRHNDVTDAEWSALRTALRDETARWATALGTPREASHVELCGMVGMIPHLAYHLGAIRQIDRATKGPPAE